MARLLVVMGSGETSPTMIKLHRSLFTRIGDGPAALLDTPYGFQENADDISAKAVAYFDASVGRTVDVVSWRRLDAPPAARERALSGLRAASWIFAGPGSPTYALRHWLDTPIPGLLADRLLTGGAVVFASAAALTLGSHTVPVYEIYKAGYEPQWRPGLDLIRETTGLPAVVVPHYDNAEGGHHDTRFCYLGERRLERMERDLPDEAFILGVDEHTAVVLDLDARTATVAGNGAMTIRRHGESTVHASGTELPFDTLATAPSTAPATGTARATGTTPTGTPPTTGTASGTAAAHGEGTPAYATALGSVPPVELPLRRDSPVRIETVRLATAFEAAGPTDVDGRVGALLELEQLLHDWSADLSADTDHARATLRELVVRLGDHAGAGDPDADGLARAPDILLELRRRAREHKDFATSDWIRDALAETDIEIRDTPDGATWHRR